MIHNLGFTKKFNLNGIITAVNSNDSLWLKAVESSVSSPTVPLDTLAEINIDLIETENDGVDLVLPLPGENFKTDEIKVILDQLVTITSYQQEEQMWQEIEGYARIHSDYAQERGTIVRLRERKVSNPFFADSFFTINLMQKMMSCRQFYTIHASCAEVNNKGVIITGPGGRGKSTSCYALARKGHPVLNDEKIMLTYNNSYRACSLSDIIKLRINAINRFFPELLSAKPIYLPDQDEFCYKAGIMPGMSSKAECSADIMIVLKQVPQPESIARPISPARVVGELFPVTMNRQNIKNNTEKFDFLTDFLQHVTCYQIDFGYDMDLFAELIENLTK